MSRALHRVDVDRVVVTGAASAALDVTVLRGLLERAVAEEAARASLPAGRVVRASVGVTAASLATPGVLAAAVATGVARAITGRSSHG